MQSLFFWKDWSKDYRYIWYGLSVIFIFSLLFMWYTYAEGSSGIIHWEKIQEQKTIETTVHNFRVGPFELTVPGESYVTFEYLQGSDIEHNKAASYIFLGILILSAITLLTIITTLSRFWYYAGMALFIVFVISLRLEVLRLFGLRGVIVPATVLLLYVTGSFYFKSFRPATSFIIRLFFFLLITMVVGFVIAFFSRVPYPILHLAVTSYITALVLSILFIIMAAHEIMVSFIYISGQSKSKSFRHFTIISTIYLFNVFVTGLHEAGVIHWNFIYINLYLLIFISAILGIWGFRLREPLYENVLSFAPFGAFMFISLATIAFITIGQLLGNANDAALKIIRDLIIFTHTGFGIIFLAYVLSNFTEMMGDNLEVYKILYKPNRMPYFTFRLAGLIVTLAFVFYSNWRDYVYHGVAGFYNYAADLYMMQGNETYARSFYNQSSNYAFQNNRANYALATIKSSRLSFDEAHKNYESANRRRPTEFSFVNDGNLYLWNRDVFSAIHAYREGEKEIKNSPALVNNLGYAYGKIHNLDSALFFINEARKYKLTRSSAEANFFALAAAEFLPIKTDSTLKLFDTSSPAVVGNSIALVTLFNQEINVDVNPLASKQLDLFSATLLNNYINRNVKKIDTTFIAEAYRIAADSNNFDYSEPIKFALAHAYYHQGNVYKALQILGELAFLSQSYQGKYNYVMGLWALEQNNPEIASSYFGHSMDADYKDAKLYKAIALTEAHKLKEALLAWDTVATDNNAGKKEMASRMKRVLTLSPSVALTLNDGEKYQYTRYAVSLRDSLVFNKLVPSFTNVNYKAQALMDRVRMHLKNDQIIPAIHYLNQVAGLELTDKTLYENIQYTELLILASRGELKNLATQINKGVTFEKGHQLEKMLYTALISEAGGDVATAKKNFELLGAWNPYFEEGILAAANFFRKEDLKSFKAYNILAEAIQVNSNSLRLLKAYAAEAARMGFDEYASSAIQRVIALEQEASR
jgi:hypothetical protein